MLLVTKGGQQCPPGYRNTIDDMKTTVYLAAALMCVLLPSGCNGTTAPSGNMGITVSFEPKDGDPNRIIFTAETTGEYGLLEWVFPDSDSRKNEESVEYYFPKKGSYSITARLWNDGKSVSDTRTVAIAQDDPNYSGPRLLWSDEFVGNKLDPASWTVETDIRVNNELQAYKDADNYEVKDGKLVITARKVNDNKQYGSYTSARIISYGKREFKYGRMEIRAKLPVGLGTWPAIWMLNSNIMKGTDWPLCGEIDIMEYVGFEPHKIHGSLHNKERNGGNSLTGHTMIQTEDDFHIYGLHWTADKIEFYVDDRTAPFYTYNVPANKTYNNWPYDEPFFFILNVAVGGDWGGLRGVDNSIFPVSMEVDYVRVYEND